MPRDKIYASYASLAPKKEPESDYKVMEIQNLEHRKKLLKETSIVCVKLHADWCQPCKLIAPDYSKLSKQYHAPGKCLMTKENVDLELTRDYNITGVPAFIFYKGGKLVLNQQDNSPVHVVGGDLKSVQEIMNKLVGQGS
jgi:thioredoxin 1